MLGSGAPDYEEALRDATRSHGFFFRAHVGFSVPLAHRVIAGCDMLLMPSRWAGRGARREARGARREARGAARGARRGAQGAGTWRASHSHALAHPAPLPAASSPAA
jgi:hypothetical protein